MTAARAPFQVTTAVEYAAHDGVSLLGDLYVPAGDGPHPIVVATPGGAWRMANRAGLKHWCEFLASHGIAAFGIEYRTSKGGPSFPKAVHDVLGALKFITGAGSSLGLDASRLGLLGASAGAHLSALTAFAGEEPLFRSAYPSDPHAGAKPHVRAVVLAYGIYDLTAHWRATRAEVSAGAEDVTLNFLGSPPEGAAALYRAASPIEYLRGGRDAPPVFLTWGDADQLVLPEQSRAFAAELIDEGVETTQVPVAGAGHHWFSQHPLDDPKGFTAALAPVVLDFFSAALEA